MINFTDDSKENYEELVNQNKKTIKQLENNRIILQKENENLRL